MVIVSIKLKNARDDLHGLRTLERDQSFQNPSAADQVAAILKFETAAIRNRGRMGQKILNHFLWPNISSTSCHHEICNNFPLSGRKYMIFKVNS